jgi:hypothetical protein
MSEDQIVHKGMTIEIWQDLDMNETPRDWDNLGTMVCFHGRYGLGDQHEYKTPNDVPRSRYKSILPLYLYDHSGITMSTSPFSCPWDSGQVGWIYADDNDIRAEYGVKRISKQLREKVAKGLSAEVEVYDQYLTGQVYGWTLRDAGGEVIDSCAGYYGDEGRIEAINQAKQEIDHMKAKAA